MQTQIEDLSNGYEIVDNDAEIDVVLDLAGNLENINDGKMDLKVSTKETENGAMIKTRRERKKEPSTQILDPPPFPHKVKKKVVDVNFNKFIYMNK